MMTTATVPLLELTPAAVADLADALRPYHASYGAFFPRTESRAWAERSLHGSLSLRPRTSVAPMVIAQLGADVHAIRAMQQCLTASTWDDAAILRRHWQEVAVDWDDAEGIRIVDGNDCPTKGTHSVGGTRQECGQLGTIANWQAGVVLAYASPHGTTLLDRRLYLPCEGVEDAAFAERRATCRIPADVTFQTKNALALVQDVLTSQTLRCRWFLADAAFSCDTGLLDAIADLGLWDLVEVPLATAIWPVAATALTTPQGQVGRVLTTAWSRHTLGNSTTGRRITDAVVQRVRVQRDGQPGPAVGLILRRDPATGDEQSAFLSNAPMSVTPARLIAVSGMRWPMEPCCDGAKQELGMGDDDVRSWPGWHHHITLVMLAHCFLVRQQRRLRKSPGAEPGADLPAVQRAAAVTATSA